MENEKNIKQLHKDMERVLNDAEHFLKDLKGKNHIKNMVKKDTKHLKEHLQRLVKHLEELEELHHQ